MESVAADVQKTSQLLSALSPRAHSLNLRCFLKFPPALPNLSVCGYHDLTGLPYPQWFHHRGESVIQRSNPNWGKITNKASQDFVRYCESHFGRILSTCLSPLSQFCPVSGAWHPCPPLVRSWPHLPHHCCSSLLSPRPLLPDSCLSQAHGLLSTQEYVLFLTHGATTPPFIMGLLLLNGVHASLSA